MKTLHIRFISCCLVLCLLAGCVIPATAAGFTDVKANSYYYDSVQWAVNNGITNGLSATSFGPNATCTRGQIVTFLYRAGGNAVSAANPFRDIKAKDYFYDPVLWALAYGITQGTSANTFSPNLGCTRAQVVTFLWRAAGCPAPQSAANPFRDVLTGQYYTQAVLWAVEQGITNGLSATNFGPNTTCTRGQIVTFLYRYKMPLSVTPSLAVYNRQTEAFVRDTNSIRGDLAALGANEYYSFSFTVKNNTARPRTTTSLYATVNGGQPLEWVAGTVQWGASSLCHIYYVHMKNFNRSGLYEVSFYLDGRAVSTVNFMMMDSSYADQSTFWASVFPIPTPGEIAAYKNPKNLRSPYLAGWLTQSDTVRFTQYSIDFKSDHAPLGTYCCLGQWFLDTSNLKSTYTNVPDYALSYGGLQNTTVTGAEERSIFSFWDIDVKDRAGNPVKIRPKIVYPAATDADEFGGEGTGARYTSHYQWEESHWYRMLLQCTTDPATGNTLVTQWFCDLETMAWTKICTYDTLMKGTFFKGSVAVFLENYLSQYAGQVRSMEVRNARIFNMDTNSWQDLKSIYLSANGTEIITEYEGSYAYGSRNDRFWMITSGVGGDWANNGKGQKPATFTLQ